MADLAAGRYGQLNPLVSMFGLANATQGNIPVRSNLEYTIGNFSDGALAASGVCAAVPVPCDPGTVISNVVILVGATGASTPTHGFAAIYSGIAVPALLANSADTTTTAIPASAPFQFAMTSAYTVKPADVPNGFLYVSLSGTGTAVQTALSVSVPTAVGYQWFSASTTPKGNAPLGLAFTHGSAVGGTPPATIASPAAKAVAPVVFLT